MLVPGAPAKARTPFVQRTGLAMLHRGEAVVGVATTITVRQTFAREPYGFGPGQLLASTGDLETTKRLIEANNLTQSVVPNV